MDNNQITMETLFAILDLRANIKNSATIVFEQESDRQDYIDGLEEHLQCLNLTLGLSLGLDFLKQTRRWYGIEMTKHNKLQKKHYDLQKERYDKCKKKNVFTKEDREFIEQNKLDNNLHKDMYLYNLDCREIVANIIEVAFPEDYDYGMDEDWIETNA